MKLITKINLILAATFLGALALGSTGFYFAVIDNPSLPADVARETFISFVLVLAGLCVALLVIINVAIRKLVLVPVSRVRLLAAKVGKGNLRDAEIKVSGNDELTEMTVAFNRMRRKIIKLVQLLRKHQAEASVGAWTNQHSDEASNHEVWRENANSTVEDAKSGATDPRFSVK